MKKENINRKWSDSLSKVLKDEIKERKRSDPSFTQEEFAEQLNISSSTLTQILKGDRNPSLDSVYNIAEELGCSIDYLAGLTKTKNREWSDIDRSIEILSKASLLSEKSLRKLSDNNNSDRALIMNEIIESDLFDIYISGIYQYFSYCSFSLKNKRIKIGPYYIDSETQNELLLNVCAKPLERIKPKSNIYKTVAKKALEECENELNNNPSTGSEKLLHRIDKLEWELSNGKQ